MNKNNNDKMFQ